LTSGSANPLQPPVAVDGVEAEGALGEALEALVAEAFGTGGSNGRQRRRPQQR
jgi:hypothetical protein